MNIRKTTIRVLVLIGAMILATGAAPAFGQSEPRGRSIGDDCTNPIVVNLPADLPFSDISQTTCGRGNDYQDTCLGAYDPGEDIIYELVVTYGVEVEITLDPKATTFTAISLDDLCPADADCIASSIDSYGQPHGIGPIYLAPNTYYIMVDKGGGPTCIAEFDLTVVELAPAGACCIGEDVCEVLTASQCAATGGVYLGDASVCDTDCNNTGIPDACDIANCDPNDPACQDCDENGIPDGCDIPACDPNDLACQDCNGNGVPDGCEWADCNGNDVLDGCDVDPNDPDGDGQVSEDYDLNGVPDECEDCDGDGIPDGCDIDCGTGNCASHPLGCGGSLDCQPNAIPDECDVDPNDPDGDGQISYDCQPNGIPDECDIGACDPNDPACQDCNGNTVPDECDLTNCDPNDLGCQDCNENGAPDECDINSGTSSDCNGHALPDECEGMVSTRLYVDTDATGSGDGSTWENAFTNLQLALCIAANNSAVAELWVAEGTYTPGTSRSASFQLTNRVAVYGGFGGWEGQLAERDWELHHTILSGDVLGNDEPNSVNNDENSYHVLITSGTDDTAVLDGFIIRAGNANNWSGGGAIYNDGGDATVRNCTFAQNMAACYGGAIHNLSGSPSLHNCAFIDNAVTGDPEIGGEYPYARGGPYATNIARI